MSSVEGERQETKRWFAGSWLAPVALFVGLLVVYVPTIVSDVKAVNDTIANSAAAWRIAHTGLPWLDGVTFPRDAANYWLTQGAGGHVVIGRTPGQILLAVPFYLGSTGSAASFSVFQGGLAAAVMTALAMVLLLLSVRRYVTPTVAVVGTLIVAITTPMWTVSGTALWTHPVTVLGILGAAWAASRERWWAAGAFLGLGILARPHEALIAAVLGLGMGLIRRDFRIVLKVGVPSLAGLALLSLWNHLVFGTWDPRGVYVGHAYSAMVPEGSGYFRNLLGFFVAGDYGWLWWTPLVVVLLPAVVRGFRAAPGWTKMLALGGVVYLLAQVGLNGYTGGYGFWGYRLALEPLACIAPLYVTTYPRAGRGTRRLVPWVSAAQFAAISFGALYLPLDIVDKYPGQEWKPNAIYLLLRDYPAASVPTLLLTAALWLTVWFLLARRLSAKPEPARSP